MMKKAFLNAVLLSGAMFLSAAEENLLKKFTFIAPGKKLADNTMELVLGRIRKDYKPPIADGGINASLNLAPGKYRLSFQYKGEKINTVTVWVQLKMKNNTKYPAKHFRKVSKDFIPAVFDFEVPAVAKTTVAVMIKTSESNKNAVTCMKDLKLVKLPAAAKK